MMTIKVITPVGDFTRSTKSNYTHAVVRRSERARAAYEEFLLSGQKQSGVDGRWVKDRGFAVTYHTSKRAARNAAKKQYGYDSKAEVVGIYEVESDGMKALSDMLMVAFKND